jgi:hypothetical protein
MLAFHRWNAFFVARGHSFDGRLARNIAPGSQYRPACHVPFISAQRR